MFMRLRNATITFSKLMIIISLMVFPDDVIVMSESLTDLFDKPQQDFDKLDQAGPNLKLTKGIFLNTKGSHSKDTKFMLKVFL